MAALGVLPERRAAFDPARGVLPHALGRLLQGIDSQRGIACRCAEILSLGEFLSSERTNAAAAHDSMTGIRQRLPGTLFEAGLAHVPGLLKSKGLLHGRRLGVDAISVETNAATKAIVRDANGKTWRG